jgi:hypothetical protein
MTAIRLQVVVALLVLGSSVGEAQTERRLAVTVAHPGALGLLWRVGKQLALRSDLSFSSTSGESPGGLESSSWSATGGLSALLPVMRIDSLHLYFVPRFSYRHVSSDGVTRSKTYSLDGGVGVQHDLARRLGAFGEAGLRYSYVKQWIIAVTGDVLPGGHSSTWSTAAGVGLMFYFR